MWLKFCPVFLLNSWPFKGGGSDIVYFLYYFITFMDARTILHENESPDRINEFPTHLLRSLYFARTFFLENAKLKVRDKSERKTYLLYIGTTV